MASAAFVAAAGALAFVVPIADPDLWWHLAAGRWIATTHAIPSVDPFGMYDASGYWGQTVLRAQWLGQLSLYGAHSLAGIGGVGVARAALLALAVAVVWNLAPGVGPAIRIAAFVPLVATLSGFTGERPQLFSIACFAVWLWALRGATRGSVRAAAALPLIAWVWFQLHAGALLVVALMPLCAALARLDVQARPSARRLWVAAAATLVASFATPNGWITYEYLMRLQSDPLRSVVSEYLSPVTLLRQGIHAPLVVWYGVALLGGIVALERLARARRWVDAGVLGATLLLGLSAWRYVAFFALAAAPLVAAEIDRLLSSRAPLRRSVATVVALAFTAYAFGQVRQGRWAAMGVQPSRYPERALEALPPGERAGTVFTSADWGGFLLWKTEGRLRPYLDTRLIEPERFPPYTHMLWWTPRGRQEFEKLGFDLVILPWRNAFSTAGDVYSLIGALAADPQWRVVWQGPEGIVLRRRLG